MKDLFVPYEQSLQLKELGFDEPCFGTWLSSFQSGWKVYELILEMGMNEEFEDNRNVYLLDGACSAPTFSQAFRWFREKYELRNSITDFIDDTTGIDWDYAIAIIGTDLDEKGNYKPLVDYSIDDETRKFKTYEEAELACLDKLIELTKTK